MFSQWSSQLPDWIELLPVQLSGREQRLSQPASRNLLDVVHTLGESILSLVEEPFALFGHSMGAIIGYELTRHLRRTVQAQPACLFVAACRAPHVARDDTPLHGLPDGEFLEQLQQRYQGLPPEISANREIVDALLPTIKADFQCLETYAHRQQPPLDCPIFACGGIDDTSVTASHLNAWKQHTNDAFTLRLFPGGHFFLKDHPTNLPGMIARHLQRIDQGSEP